MTSKNLHPPQDSDLRSAWVAWAREAVDAGDWEGAAERWKACIAKFGPKPEWEARIGTALLELGRSSDAERIFTALAEKGFDDQSVHLGLVRLAMRAQDWAGALARLTNYRASHPGAASGMMATVLLRLGRAVEAEAIWAELLAEKPGNRSFQLMHLRAGIEVARKKGLSAGDLDYFVKQIDDIAVSADDGAGAAQAASLFELLGERRRTRDQLLHAVQLAATLDQIDICFKIIPRRIEANLQAQLLERLLSRVRTDWIAGKPLSPRALNIELRLLLALERFGEFEAKFDDVADRLPEAPDLKLLNAVRTRLRKPRHEIFAEPKIFGIGLSKTGTTSLSEALSIVGIDSAHWFNPLTHRPISDMDIFLFGASSDTCISSRFEQLYYLYPNAKFVLTKRDFASWQQSYLSHHARHHLESDLDGLRSLYDCEDCPYGFPSSIIQFSLYLNYKNLSDAFQTYENRVRHFFSDKPAEKLLELDLFAGQGWPELCKFLERPVPDRAFPWVNKDAASGASVRQG